MRSLRALLTFAILVVATICFGIIGATWHFRDIPPATLTAKYATSESKFITVSGVKIHYRDEGNKDGPVVVLMHAHWGSLIMWDSWVERLNDKYRVLRFDMTGHGLSGVDPTGDYTLERGVELMELFFEAMSIDRFALVGTSLGGTHAIHFTVKHPNQVERLVLLNPGALNSGVRGRSAARSLPWWIDALTIITPRAFFQLMLEGGFGDSRDVPDDIVTRWHELQLAEMHRPAELERTRQYVSGDIVGLIKEITAPTLVMWGKENPVVTVDQAFEFISLLESAEDRQLVIYPGLGHMAVLEDGITIANDIRAYLDGTKQFTDDLPG